ncbi:MAG TPA: chemotaxis protein CheC [Sporosarcina sp.]|nr:chemotaxis protein CheC [Sporosarcina sp.]
MTNEPISHLHLDVLKEIGNIGAAHAATSLSQLLQKKVDMYVPNVKLATFDEVFELAGGAEELVASIFLRIQGDITGSMFFMLSIDGANHLIQSLIQDDSFDLREASGTEVGVSSMQELGNILSGSYLTALSNFTNLNIQPTVPSLSIDMVGAIMSFGLLDISTYADEVIVVDTEMIEEREGNTEAIRGNFFLLPDPPSYKTIFQSLGVM